MGIDKLLLNKVSDILQSLNKESVSLMVASNNPTKKLYLSEGFVISNSFTSKQKGKLLGISDWEYMVKKL